MVEAKVNQSGDWKPMSAAFVDRLGGRCSPAGVTAKLYEFLYPRPCRLTVADAEVELETSQLPAGDHLVRAELEDGAGNRTDIVPQRIVHVDAPDLGTSLGGNTAPPPPNNGQGASTRALVRLALTARTTSYHHKPRSPTA